MKKIFLCLCLFVGLVGCSKKESTTVCTLQQDNVKIVNTVIAEGDQVIKQTMVNELNYKNLGLTKDALSELVNEYETNYDIDGLDYSFEIKENELIETITIDYAKANLEELMSVGLIESVEDAKYISLKVTLETIQDTGFVCE